MNNTSTKIANVTAKGTQTVKVLLELGLITTTRTIDLKGKELSTAQLTKIAKKSYSSIVNMGGKVKIVDSEFRTAK
jgi:hypothetical protein